MSKKGVSALTLLVGAWLATATYAQAGLPTAIKIGTEGAYAPFNFVDPQGKPQGFEIDLGNALCEKMSIKCEFVVQDWDGLIPALLAKKFDAIMASLYITDERRKKIAFSNKYYQTPGRFVVAKDSKLEITPEGLAGKAVGTQRATSFERFLRDQFPKADLRVYATFDEAYLDLAAGRTDVLMGDVVAVSEAFLKKDGGAGFEFRGPSYSGKAWFGEGAGVGLRQEDTDLLAAFNQAIQAVRADGTYDKLSRKWFGFDVYGE
jgi:lysine-arginine-ornithine-binding protein